jgi:hypothetical protein
MNDETRFAKIFLLAVTGTVVVIAALILIGLACGG